MSYEYSRAFGMGSLGTTELARVAYSAGTESYQAGNYSAALEHFREAERQDTNPTGVAISNTMTWMACCYARLNRCSEALDIFENLRSYWNDAARTSEMRNEATTLYNRCRAAETSTASHESLHETSTSAQTVATSTQPTSSPSTSQIATIVDNIFGSIWGTSSPTEEQILTGPSQTTTSTGSKPTTGKTGVTSVQTSSYGNGSSISSQSPTMTPIQVDLPGAETDMWLLYGGLGVVGVALLGGILYLAFRSKPQIEEGVES